MTNKQSNGFRTFTFWTATILTMTVVIICDVLDLVDPAIMVYMATSLVALVCGIMFADWWRVKGSASSVYKWITILLFTLVLNDAMQFVARYIMYYSPHDEYDRMVHSLWWQYRSVPKLAALLYLLSFAIWQRWGKASVYDDGVRHDMADGFKMVEARILAGEIRFEGHSHEGMVLGAKLIIKPIEEKS